ncbi:MAG: dihydropteroate synthase [Deltaproteobacteria bacterium]|nr:dihydropteroate synthase [Deltaproteobacteria bacterium]
MHLKTDDEACKALKKVKVDPYGIEAMLPKMQNLNILLEQLECKVANIIKQEMLSVGGDCAVARESVSCTIPATDAIIMGTLKQIQRFSDKITLQPFGLKAISKEISVLLQNLMKETHVLKTNKREIVLGDRSMIMGILNVTPDSFSDGGHFMSAEDAVKHGIRMVEEGADIIDVGGESSRPGAESIPVKEELQRVIPVIGMLSEKIHCPISIDTTKAEVAREAVQNGAEIVNDISAMRFDDRMPEVIKDAETAIVLMHMRGTPGDMQKGDIRYENVRGDIINFLRNRIDAALHAGIQREKIIIDPGIGFGKMPEDNLQLLKYLQEFKVLGLPIMVGTSRKSFIGHITGGNPLHRLEGTTATIVIAIMNGAHILRVHDVEFIKKAAVVTDAVKNVI